MNEIENPNRRTENYRLSLVVPIYNEASGCDDFFDAVIPVLESVTGNFEIICINDGSTDNSLSLLQQRHADDSRIKVIDLTRNFGKELALTAGLDLATGDAVIPIDADLQDPPDLIPQLVERWLEGFDMVVAVREDRASDSWLRRTTANIFYRLLGRIGEVPVPSNAGDFRLMDRVVVEVIKRLPERNRFMKGLFAWVGFRQAVVTYARPARRPGKQVGLLEALESGAGRDFFDVHAAAADMDLLRRSRCPACRLLHAFHYRAHSFLRRRRGRLSITDRRCSVFQRHQHGLAPFILFPGISRSRSYC